MSDFHVFCGKTTFPSPTSAFLAQERRFHVQDCRFCRKNDDFKSKIGIFVGRMAISSPTFPFLDARTEILNPTFWISAGENIFSWLNRSYSPEKDFPWLTNGIRESESFIF